MGWSEKYKKSIDCKNPKGFSQRAHCQGRKVNEQNNDIFHQGNPNPQMRNMPMGQRNVDKLASSYSKSIKSAAVDGLSSLSKTAQSAKNIKIMNSDSVRVAEAKEKQDHEVSMAKTQVKKSIDNLQKVARVLAKKTDADNLPAWVQAKLTDTEHNTDAAASYMGEEKKKCGEGKYWCRTDQKCKKIPSGHHVMPNGDLMKDSEHEESGDVSEGKRDGKSAKDKDYSLRDWFKGGGWVQAGGKYDGKPCAKQKGQKTKPFCRDADDRAAMSKDEREKRAKKKRREDPNPNRKGKAKMVREAYQTKGTKKYDGKFNDAFRKAVEGAGGDKKDIYIPKSQLQQAHFEPEGEVVSEKKDACYKKVKARYDVWPSAYASGALVKCRKVGAANWGNKTKKEEYELSNWREDFKALEIETIDLIKAESLISEQQANSQKDQKGLLGKPVGYNNPETTLQKANRELTTIRRLKQKTGLNIGNTSNNASYSDGNVSTNAFESKDPCWVGYKQVGMKKKGGKMVPNCVKEGYSNWREELVEDWQKVNKGDKTDGMSQKAVNAYRRENPGSKLKTAVTEKKPKGKRAKRRKSFCARSKGQQDMHNIDCSKTPDKAICKARRRWRC